MMQTPFIEATLVAVTVFGSALVALLVVWFVAGRRTPPDLMQTGLLTLEDAVFLFDGEELIDVTGPGRALLEAVPMGVSDWARLGSFLAARLGGLAAALDRLEADGRIEMDSDLAQDAGRKPLQLIAEAIGPLTRITLIDPEAEGRGVLVDGLSQRAMEDEIDQLRQTLDRAPAPIWREDEKGTVVWANRAYILRSGALDSSEDSFAWPLPHLFNLPPGAGAQGPVRQPVEADGGATSWFDCHTAPMEGGVARLALPADATVRAERALRDFVQTLTKTFADLPIGLAVFDRQRQLQLFNPALIDLLQLGPDFLSARPTLYAFLDRLRETRMMPEPKDYRSWRLQMSELEKAAAAGFHAETWSLPSGQTYRVTGRPHPDGAVAFLFEDISAEMSLTRCFRAELEQSQEIIDLMEDAIAVFQPSGELALANAAYGELWRVEPEATLGRITLSDAISLWQDSCERTPIWYRIQRALTQPGERLEAEADIVLRGVGKLICRVVPLAGGALAVRFMWPRGIEGTPGRRVALQMHG